MPFIACVMDWARNRILRVDKNSDPILSRLWTKVHEILGQCRDVTMFAQCSECQRKDQESAVKRRESLVLSRALTRLPVSCFVQKIFAIKSRKSSKNRTIKRDILGASFLGRDTSDFSMADC